VDRVREMELTFSCEHCGAIGQLSPLETSSQAECRKCGTIRLLHPEATVGAHLQGCPWCLTTDLYAQKDFPQGLGLFIVVVGFAISTVFWYYEMPISTAMVLVASMALDLVLYHTVPSVIICYRCLCQMRGIGTNDDGRFKPFDLSIGERYRQERIRVEQLRGRGASAE
jgi:hypothetical protein